MSAQERAAEVMIAQMYRPAHEVGEGWEDGDIYEHFDLREDLAYQLAPALAAAGLLVDDDTDRLRTWKAEASIVLAEWEAVWEAAGRPGRLGSSKAGAVARLVKLGKAVEERHQQALDEGGDRDAVRVCDEIEQLAIYREAEGQ